MGPIDDVRTLDDLNKSTYVPCPYQALGNEISDEEPQKAKCTVAIKSGTNPDVYYSVKDRVRELRSCTRVNTDCSQ